MMEERVFTLLELLILFFPFIVSVIGTVSKLKVLYLLGGMLFIVVGLWSSINIWVTLLYIGCGALSLILGISEMLK